VTDGHRQVDREQRDGDGHDGVGEEDQPVDRAGIEGLLAVRHRRSLAADRGRPIGDHPSWMAHSIACAASPSTPSRARSGIPR
jgi:hypothetical protein